MQKTILLSVLFVFVSSSLAAQVPDQVRQRRRAFLEDLLNVVIESQSDRDIVPARPGRPVEGRPDLRPGFGNTYGPTTQRMVSCRKQFQVWEDECGRLVSALRTDERRLPRLRPLLADAIQILASITHLRGHAGRLTNIQPLTETYCELDANWRLLNHRLRQIRGLPPACIQCLDR